MEERTFEFCYTEEPSETRKKEKGTPGRKTMLSPYEKQSNHNESERRRQQSINEGIERLKELVPGCRDQRISKATVLSRSVSYIEITKNQIVALKQENTKLRDALSIKSPPSSLYNIDSPVNYSSDTATSSPPVSHDFGHHDDQKMGFKSEINHELYLSPTASRVLEEEIAVQTESVNIYMPHGVQYPSSNTVDYSQDVFLSLFMIGSVYVATYSTTFSNSMSTLSSNPRSLLSTENLTDSSNVWFLIETALKVYLIIMLAKYLISYRSLILYKRNRDLEIARKHRFLGEVALCSSDFNTAEQHFHEALQILGDTIGYIPHTDSASNLQVFKQSLRHILHYFKPFILIDGWIMKINGIAAASREAKLCLIGLYNVKEAKNPRTFDTYSCAILLTAINLAECLDPRSQRMANIYTIWGTVLSADETLQSVAKTYYKRGLKIAKEHGPFAVAHINAIWQSKQNMVGVRDENQTALHKVLSSIVYFSTVVLQFSLLLVNGPSED